MSLRRTLRMNCHRASASRFLAASLFAVLSPLASAQPAQAACAAPEYRQFDFWLGEWEVRGPAGRLAGINRIAAEYGGCVVHEHYETDRGYRGESLNTFDPGRKVWHQTWVDNSGLLLLLEGGLRGTNMVLEGDTVDAAGTRTSHRMTWTPYLDGSVRQLWESTDAKGNWSVAFDGKYTKRTATK